MESFFACSGALGLHGEFGQLTTTQVYANTGRATPLIEIFNFEISANGSPNRMGFFGSAKAPNSAVIVGQYQDTTFRTNDTGGELGEMINVKYTGASTADVSGILTDGPFFGSDFAVGSIPNVSGTLLCRFTEPNGTNVITQQATFRAVDFGAPGPATGDTSGAASGVPNIGDLASSITIQAAQLQDTSGNAADASWSEISDGGAALSLADQSIEQAVHDFHLIVSATPAAAGRKIDFGYYIQLEFL